MKRQISLNRTLLVGVTILYSAILVLLLALDINAIIGYRSDIYANWDSENEEFAETLQETVAEISSDLYEVYAYDPSFEGLETEEGIDCLQDVADLNNKFKAFLADNEYVTGYTFYYDTEEFRRSYVFQNNFMSKGSVEDAKNVTETLVDVLQDGHQWFYVEGTTDFYAVCAYEKQNAAVMEMVSLNYMASEYLRQNEGQEKEAFFVYDGKIYGENSNEDYREFASEIEGDTYSRDLGSTYLNAYAVGKSGLYLCTAIKTGFTPFVNVQSLILVLITLISVVAIVYLMIRLRRGLLQPLRSLTEQMEEINVGDVEPIQSHSSFRELEQVADTVNNMVERLHEQERLTYEQTLEGQRARMQYLSMQLKPHFYLNGLKALNAVALNGDTDKIQDIIMQLSEHLRGKLGVERDLVTLESECKFADNYVALQCNITDRPISIEWHSQEKLGNWTVPNLCIQTFVENSIKYAKLGNIQSELKIYISLTELETEEGKFLDLYVKDNGAGYSDEVLAIINEEPTEGKTCIGINNLKRRCKLIYKGRAEYVFGNDDGAVSNLILPWMD